MAISGQNGSVFPLLKFGGYGYFSASGNLIGCTAFGEADSHCQIGAFY
jgi:hypothetical protein